MDTQILNLYFLKKHEYVDGYARINTPIIYLYIVLFGPVKPELGVIPLGQKKIIQKLNI